MVSELNYFVSSLKFASENYCLSTETLKLPGQLRLEQDCLAVISEMPVAELLWIEILSQY